MKAIILGVGNELISGQTVDTNSAYLSRELGRRGIETLRHETVGDETAAIAGALSRAAAEAEIVLVTGGLGPTADDVTRYGLASVMGAELQLDGQCLREIEDFFQRRGKKMVLANRVQAMIPRGAEPMANAAGTAPGIVATLDGAEVFVMPGVPYEMRDMFESSVLPRLPAGDGVIVHHIVHTFGMGESDVGERIEDLMRAEGEVTIGTTVSEGMVSVRIIASAETIEVADRQVDDAVRKIRSRLGEVVVSEGDETMGEVIGKSLKDRRETLATAESCTGGMIGEMITAVPGSSEYYLGGAITYANEVKLQMLGVEKTDLEAHGAVSEQVAAAMARGCRERFGSDWAIGVTGIAGPTGQSPDKPLGLVYIALAGEGTTDVHRHVFGGSREIVRRRAALSALNHLRLAML